ncbi:chemotaxis protein CheB [Methylobacterium nigriterrae]|uniref:chemotaxis protein CheB n=1 Tax=Methylobacterium nigriterrae TaxID=3127512 RepID=UPI0030132571
MATSDIIVIGGSTGAIDVLRTVCGGLRAGLPAAILAVVHLSHDSLNQLGRILDESGPLPAATAREGEPIENGRIYVAPAGLHMLVTDRTVALRRGPRENMARPAIDPLFRSAALSHGPRVIGVLLSGRLNDGAAGLAAVKSCGGRAVVQDPDDALAPEMPRGALRTVAVDRCTPAANLASVIAELAATPPGPALPVPPDLGLEVAIAAGGSIDSNVLRAFAEPAPLTCPDCGGVLSQVRAPGPLRFRCQVGHGFTGQVLADKQEGAVDEALRVALRIVEERVELLARLARNSEEAGQPAIAATYMARSQEYRDYAQTIRNAILSALAPLGEPAGR